MAGITSSGIGSGLDVQSLVAQLVASERAPADTRLNTMQSKAQSQLSAFGVLQAAFEGIKSSLVALRSGDAFKSFTVATGDATVLTATASTSAAAGTNQVDVLALASAQTLRSAAMPADIAPTGGVMHFAVGDKSFDVTVPPNSAPPAIRDAINAAAVAAGAKMSASIINADDGAHLTLSATATGVANAITVTRASGDTGLDALVYNPGVSTTLTEQVPASDASIKINGLAVTSSSNQISNALPGITLDLKSAKPGTAITVTTSRDRSAATKAVQALVTSYNQALTTLNSATKYNADTRTASVLTGDSLTRDAGQQLRSALGGALASGGNSGAALGISTKVDGTLTLDTVKFEAALAADASSVEAAFTGTAGVVARLDTVLSGLTGSTNRFTERSDSLRSKLKDVTAQRSGLDVRMDALKLRYTKQFNAMDSMVAQLGNTSKFLTQQFAAKTSS